MANTGAGGSGREGWGRRRPARNRRPGDPLTSSGIYALDAVELFSLLSIPDATRAASGDPHALDTAIDPNRIYGAAIAYCKNQRTMLLIDAPPGVDDAASAVEWRRRKLTTHDENGAAFFPCLSVPDPLAGRPAGAVEAGRVSDRQTRKTKPAVGGAHSSGGQMPLTP